MKAIKLYSQAPSNPRSIPQAWPWQMQDCTSAQVSALESQGFIILTDEAYVTYLATHQAEYDAWATANPVVPQMVTPRQIRLALLTAGRLASVTALFDSLPEPLKTQVQITWDYSNEFQRTNPLLIQLGPAMGFSEAELDQLFILANSL